MDSAFVSYTTETKTKLPVIEVLMTGPAARREGCARAGLTSQAYRPEIDTAGTTAGFLGAYMGANHSITWNQSVVRSLDLPSTHSG
jgi:hypothetical protein